MPSIPEEGEEEFKQREGNAALDSKKEERESESGSDESTASDDLYVGFNDEVLESCDETSDMSPVLLSSPLPDISDKDKAPEIGGHRDSPSKDVGAELRYLSDVYVDFDALMRRF